MILFNTTCGGEQQFATMMAHMAMDIVARLIELLQMTQNHGDSSHGIPLEMTISEEDKHSDHNIY